MSKQIIAFVTPSAVTIDTEEFVRVLRGRQDGFPEHLVLPVFRDISNGADSVSLEAVERSINRSKYPEIVEGFAAFMGAYSDDGESLDQDQFLRLHQDLYTSLPSRFSEVVRSIWTASS